MPEHVMNDAEAAEAFKRFSMGLDYTNRSDAEAGFRAGWDAAQRPPVSPEVREEIRGAILSVRVAPTSSTMALYAGEDGKLPLYDAEDPEVDAITDAILARLSLPSQPVYDEMHLDAMALAFKRAWHAADDEGQVGGRTIAGLRAALAVERPR